MLEQDSSLAVSNAEIGKNIIEAATNARRQRHQARIVQIADSEMETINVCQRKIDYYRNALEKSKKRIAAIELGKFTVSETGQFQFEEEALHIITAEDPMDKIVARAEEAFRHGRL